MRRADIFIKSRKAREKKALAGAIGNPSGTNKFLTERVFDTDIAAPLTDHKEQGDLHHTMEEIIDEIAAALLAGNALTLTYNDAAGTITIDLDKCAASPTVPGSAGAAYGATEQQMLNDCAGVINDHIAKEKAAGHMAP